MYRVRMADSGANVLPHKSKQKNETQQHNHSCLFHAAHCLSCCLPTKSPRTWHHLESMSASMANISNVAWSYCTLRSCVLCLKSFLSAQGGCNLIFVTRRWHRSDGLNPSPKASLHLLSPPTSLSLRLWISCDINLSFLFFTSQSVFPPSLWMPSTVVSFFFHITPEYNELANTHTQTNTHKDCNTKSYIHNTNLDRLAVIPSLIPIFYISSVTYSLQLLHLNLH